MSEANPTPLHSRNLLERAKSGDGRAWAEVYAQHRPAVLRSLQASTTDLQLAEDLTQETFAQAHACLDRFEGRSSLRSWLLGIAHNTRRNHARAYLRFEQIRRRYADTREMTCCSESLERRQAKAQAVHAVHAAVDDLPQHLQLAFRLRYIEGLSLAHAAQRLGLTPNNVGVQAHRAKARVRSVLQRRGWTVSQLSC